MLSSIHVLCFFATCALVVLGLEVSRLFFRMPVRLVVMLAIATLGLAAQTLYLVNRATTESLALSTWHDWFLVAAWLLVAVYLGLTLSRPTTMVGVFLWPVVIALMLIAAALPRDAVFPRDRARLSWELAHGMMLLAGMVTVSLGFVAGLMYLVQSYRLKHHVSPQSGLKLPSLEWLQAVNKQSLVYSSFFIALGLVAGIVLNTIKARVQADGLPWTDSVVISSAVLLIWLLAATAFEWLYKPAQQGRKVAYLTVASFVFLALVITMLLIGGSEHAQPEAGSRSVGSRLVGDRSVGDRSVGDRSVGDRSVGDRSVGDRLAGERLMHSVLGTEYWVPGTGYIASVVPTTDRPTSDHRPPTDRREAGP